jgi:SAM-dependent methyltransferase
MKGLTTETYGESIADIYDDFHPIAPGNAVALFVELTQGVEPKNTRVLELGIGTGRVAVPLAARGLEVHGVDASDAMIAQLRAKPGAERITVTKGDFSEAIVGDSFALAFVAFNTFFALPSQEHQKRCFRTVSKQLAPGGVFVVEVFVPDAKRFEQGQALRTARVEVDRVVLEATRHDRASQTLDAQLILITTTGTRLIPLQLRYAWPAELDLMAELAGLRLRERWASYTRTPFTSDSAQHVSIYEKV